MKAVQLLTLNFKKRSDGKFKVAGERGGVHSEIIVHKYLVFFLIPQVSHCFLITNPIVARF